MRFFHRWIAGLSVWLAIGATSIAFAGSAVDPATSKELSNLTHAQMRGDLQFLRDVWKPQDHSFTGAQSEEFNRLIASDIAHADELDPVSFWMRVSRVVALSGNGHTNVNRGFPPFVGLPFEAWWFRDGLYIVETAPANAELLGARIDKIGSRTAEEALSAVTPFISGNVANVRNASPAYLRIPGLLHRLGMTDSDTRARLTVRLRTGKEKKVTLAVQEGSDAPPNAESDTYGVLIPQEPDEVGRWPHVLDGVKERPDIYQKPVDLAFHWIGAGHRVLYLRSNQVSALDGNLTAFELKLVQLLMNEIVPNRPKAVIVDLRLNQGGNFLNTVLFCQALPKVLSPGGKVLVLVSRSTFSAAILTAAMLREYGGASVTFLGTDMGDNERFYAEGSRVPLPDSKLGIRVSTGLHDWSEGCHDLERCFWPVVVWGPQDGQRISLHPDIEIEPSFAEYAAGRDPVMEKALTLVP